MLLFHDSHEVDAFQLNSLDYIRTEVLSVTQGQDSFLVLTSNRALLFSNEMQPLREFFDVVQAYHVKHGVYSLVCVREENLEIWRYDYCSDELLLLHSLPMAQVAGLYLSGELILVRFTDAVRLFCGRRIVARFNPSDMRRCDLHEGHLTVLDVGNVLRVFAVNDCAISQLWKVKLNLLFATNVFYYGCFVVVIGEKLMAIDCYRRKFFSQPRHNISSDVHCVFTKLGDYAFVSQGFRLVVLSLWRMEVSREVQMQFPGAMVNAEHVFVRGTDSDGNGGECAVFWMDIAKRRASPRCESIFVFDSPECACARLFVERGNNQDGGLVRICTIDAYFTSYVGVARDRLFVGGWDGVLRIYKFISI